LGVCPLVFDMQKKMEQMVDLIKRLKLCVQWCANKIETLHSEVESAVKKCSDTGIFFLPSFVINIIVLGCLFPKDQN